MDRLESMSIVLAVAEAGSLSAAARRLNTPVATASRKISELEAHLRTSCSIARLGSWRSLSPAAPMSPRQSASWPTLRKLSVLPPANIQRRPAS